MSAEAARKKKPPNIFAGRNQTTPTTQQKCSAASFCAPRGPRCRSSAAPLYLALRAREGGRLGVGWSAGGPRVWLTVRSAFCSLCRFCRAREHAPRASLALGAAPQSGAIRWLLDVGVLRQGASRSAVSFTRVPDANLDAKILAKKPTKLGGQRRRRGGHVPALCKTIAIRKTRPPKEAPQVLFSQCKSQPFGEAPQVPPA